MHFLPVSQTTIGALARARYTSTAFLVCVSLFVFPCPHIDSHALWRTIGTGTKTIPAAAFLSVRNRAILAVAVHGRLPSVSAANQASVAVRQALG